MSRIRLRLCKCCGDLHDVLKQWPTECLSHFGRITRSDLAAPNFMSDHMDAIESPVSGKMYDSKAALRAEYKAAGMVELGNERLKPVDRDVIDEKDIQESIAQAWNQLDP